MLQTVEEEVPVDDDEAAEEDAEEEISDDDEEGKVEEEEDEKPKTKKVEKTVWDWVLVNDNKPIWTRKYVAQFSCCSNSLAEHLRISRKMMYVLYF